jgi:hypothetical protein
MAGFDASSPTGALERWFIQLSHDSQQLITKQLFVDFRDPKTPSGLWINCVEVRGERP